MNLFLEVKGSKSMMNENLGGGTFKAKGNYLVGMKDIGRKWIGCV